MPDWELISRPYLHPKHRTILGFKSLFLGISDGKKQFILEFAILGKKGVTKYGFEGKKLTAWAMINLLETRVKTAGAVDLAVSILPLTFASRTQMSVFIL